MPNRPVEAERQAAEVERALAARGSRPAARAASGTSTTPIGTLIQKIQCQEAAWMTAPPTSGPSATAMPLIPDQTPSASPRWAGGKASASSVSVSGVAIAAPTPWHGAGGDQQADARRQCGGGRARR